MLERTGRGAGWICLMGLAVWVPMMALHQFGDLKLNMKDNTTFWLVVSVWGMCVGGFVLWNTINWLNRHN
jgi:hypothetical protein